MKGPSNALLISCSPLSVASRETMSRIFLTLAAATCLGWLSLCWASTDNRWVLVDTHDRTLAVMNGEKVLKTFHGIALGRGGTSQERHRGDGKTPLGVFYIGWIKWNSPFHIFIGLDFPSWDYAERAYKHKLIDDKTYIAIQDALLRGETPPQDTPLGGHIGIHGIGSGDPLIHEAFNWTNGCIALTNEQIEQLASLVLLGTKVVIK